MCDLCLEKTRRERSLTRVFHCLKEDYREVVARCQVEGKTECEGQNAQLATKEIPIEHKEKKNLTVRVVKHWTRLFMEAVEPPSVETLKINCVNS